MTWKSVHSLVLTATLVWIHCLLPVIGSFPVGPPRRRLRCGFSWEASVDAPSGIATSRETMRAGPNSGIVRHFFQFHRGFDERRVWAEVMDRLEGYPEWLARGAVSFGLLRAVPIPGGGCSLRDRFLGIDLLTFGPPQSFVSSLQIQMPLFSAGGANMTTMNDKDHGLQLQRQLGDCTVILPIVGGLLALCKPTRHKSGDMGCLKFTLKHQVALAETQLVTEIQGYSPSLVGSKEPVPFYRRCWYLSTQSLIHAYVMWRFQRHCIHTRYSPIQQSRPTSGHRSDQLVGH